MYEVEARVYEKHGEYEGYLAVWSSDGGHKTMLVNEYSGGIKVLDPAATEHLQIVEVIHELCSRIAQRWDEPLPWRVGDEV